MTVTNISKLSFKEITVLDPVKKENGVYISELQHNTRPMLIQLDDVLLTSNTSIQITEHQQEFFNNMDNLIMETIVKKGIEWFKKEYSIDDIYRTFITTIKPLSNKLFLDNITEVPIFDNHTNYLGKNLSFVSPEIVSVILECQVVFLSTRVSCNWNPIQLRKKVENNPVYLFSNED